MARSAQPTSIVAPTISPSRSAAGVAPTGSIASAQPPSACRGMAQDPSGRLIGDRTASSGARRAPVAPVETTTTSAARSPPSARRARPAVSCWSPRLAHRHRRPGVRRRRPQRAQRQRRRQPPVCGREDAGADARPKPGQDEQPPRARTRPRPARRAPAGDRRGPSPRQAGHHRAPARPRRCAAASGGLVDEAGPQATAPRQQQRNGRRDVSSSRVSSKAEALQHAGPATPEALSPSSRRVGQGHRHSAPRQLRRDGRASARHSPGATRMCGGHARQ